LSRPALGPI